MRSKKLKRKRIRIASIVIFTLMVIMMCIFMGYLKYTNVLSMKYYGAILFMFLVIVLLTMAITFKKNIKSGIKIFFDVIMVIITCLLVAGMFPMSKLMNFMGNIQDDNKEYENYYVLVLKDSKYDKLNDIKNKNIGILKSDDKEYKNALEKLNDTVKTKQTDYKDSTALSDNLLNKKEEAIFIDSVGYYMTEEETSKYYGKFKVLDTINIATESKIEKEDVNVVKESFNIYISGIDTYGKISTKSRSDVNIIATVNPKTNKVLLTSIPRDYYVQLHGTTGYKDKLTHAGVYGINQSINTIEDLLDIKINYYMRVNFTTLIKMVDVIGGVDINSDMSFYPLSDSTCYIKKGNNHLNGKCALAYARERHAYASGDRHRGQNQQQIITAMINKFTTNKSLVLKYNSIFNSLEGSFQTNMGTSKITSLVQKQIDSMPSWDIESYNLDGSGKMTYTYSYPGQKLYVMVPYEETVETAKTKIDSLLQE